MDKKTISTMVAVAVLAGALGFYSGTYYEKSQKGRAFGGDQAGMRNWSGNGGDSGRMMVNGQGMPSGQNGGGSKRMIGNFASGEIIKKDDKSLTIKLDGRSAGGSKLIFFSDKTSINKMASTTKDELAVGVKIMANGEGSNDGSLVADSIQIRPENAFNGGPNNRQEMGKPENK